MRKRSLSILLVFAFALAVVLGACGNDTGATSGSAGSAGSAGNAATEDEVITFTANYFSPENIPPGRALQYACDRATELSGGRLQFDTYFNGTLVSWDDQVTATSDGTIDISANDMSQLSPLFPFNNLFMRLTEVQMPDRTSTQEIYNEALKKFPQLQDELETKNVHALYIHSLGGYNIHYGFKDETGNPGALKGKVVDVAGDYSDYIQKFGASGVVTGAGDWYLNLQKGTTDANLCLWATLNGFKLYELTKTHVAFGPDTGDHPYDGGGLFQPGFVYLINLDKWNSLTEADQKILEQAFEDASKWWIAIDWVSQVDGWERSKADGQNIIYLDTAEKQKPWLDPAKEINDKWIQDVEALGYPAGEAWTWMKEQFAAANQAAGGIADDWPGAVPSEETGELADGTIPGVTDK